MKKATTYVLTLLTCLVLLAGCSLTRPGGGTTEPAGGKLDAIPFADGQYYAAAYLGYQTIENLDFYVEQYLDSNELPTHYLSAGDYYLVIPRYPGMAMSLYQNDMETMDSVLVYEDPDCRPFIIQCNASDIFADATIRLTYGEETVEFSPFISLMDGSVDVGPNGLDLTNSGETP